ncbi:hypothetical protein [Tianweitania sediminis]|uniref:Uncharacterized protein n=1 Tax=Tianweitania sediminis TaxID=1502156 RepID=A0A8J7UI39_9HYPH|nr:hypothetical protein [Tianweitania sediminis]MBP0437370.1 hypothetical protein [Tianweitania sediminis]HEV7414682.1 hypothetical protein [Tianweitania sediminis]
MEPLEKAIRSALDKGNAADSTFREKVYRSAFSALERALASPNIPESTIAVRRTGLQEIITRVESEHRRAAATPGASQTPPPVELSANDRPGDGDPDFRARREPIAPAPRPDAPADEASSFPSSPRVDPSQSERLDEYRIDADLDESTVVGETRAVRRQRRPFAWLLILATVVALAAVAAWWTLGSGLLVPQAERDGAVPNPSPVQDDESFDPAGQTGSSAAPTPLGRARNDPNAVVLFSPEEPGGVTTPGDAVAEVVGEGEQALLRIRSGASGSAVAFNVPQAVLQQLAGRRAVFVVSAQAEEGRPTQISVSCSFGELGDCGRQRYDVTIEQADYIFDVDMPAVQPGADGTITIVSDVSSSGKAVDIYGIRVSVD